MASTNRAAKLFVARLPWVACRESLKNHFQEFGSLKETRVIFDSATGRSKKFGFVVYKDSASAENALNSGPHFIEGKEVAVLLSEVPSKKSESDDRE